MIFFRYFTNISHSAVGGKLTGGFAPRKFLTLCFFQFAAATDFCFNPVNTYGYFLQSYGPSEANFSENYGDFYLTSKKPIEMITEDDQMPRPEIETFSKWQKNTKIDEKPKETNSTANFTHNSKKSPTPTKSKNITATQIYENYASPKCGAKIISFGGVSAENFNSLLDTNKDTYMKAKCWAGKENNLWFAIELCEPIKIKEFHLANYELFSGSPKEIELFVSEKNDEWKVLDQKFFASEKPVLQKFPVRSTSSFYKFVKINVVSVHGAEHFCPISYVAVLGENWLYENENSDDDEQSEEIETNVDLPSSVPTILPPKEQPITGKLNLPVTDPIKSKVKKLAVNLKKCDIACYIQNTYPDKFYNCPDSCENCLGLYRRAPVLNGTIIKKAVEKLPTKKQIPLKDLHKPENVVMVFNNKLIKLDETLNDTTSYLEELSNVYKLQMDNIRTVHNRTLNHLKKHIEQTSANFTESVTNRVKINAKIAKLEAQIVEIKKDQLFMKRELQKLDRASYRKDNETIYRWMIAAEEQVMKFVNEKTISFNQWNKFIEFFVMFS